MGFQDNYRLFTAWLNRQRSRHLAALFLHGTVQALAVCALAWLGAILLGVLPIPARPLLWTALAASVAAIFVYLVLPLVRAPGLGGFARLVDRAFPELKDRTINSLELGGKLQGGKSPAHFDPAFVEALLRDTRGRTESLDTSARLRPRGTARWAGGFLGAAATLAALLLLWPQGFGASARRLLRPTQGALEFGLRVRPGDVTIKPGADVGVEADLRGTRGTPRLLVRGDYETWREAPLEGRAGADSGWQGFGARLPAVQRNMSYRIEVDGRQSPIYNVHIREPLAVLSFHKRITAPAYSSLPVQEGNSATGELDALKGSRAELILETSGDVVRAALVVGERTLPLEKVAPNRYRGWLTLTETSEYKVRLEETGGQEALSGPYALHVLDDSPPTVALTSPDHSGFLSPEMRIPIAAEAADDYGLSKAELVYQMGPGETHRVPLNFAPGARQAQLALDWDASILNPGPGESVTLWVEVRDNDAVSGPKMARSETRVFRAPTAAEMFKANEAQTDENIKDLSRVSEQQKELKEKLEQATRSMQRNETSMSWEKRKQVESAVGQQKEMLQKIQKSTDQINEQLDKMEQQNVAKDEVLRKMEQIRELVKELDSPELREMLKKLDETLKRANPDEVKKALENMKMSEQDLLATMERTLEALKQLQKTQKLNAAQKLAEEIAKQQKALADQLDKQQEDQKPSAENQKSMADQQGDLKKQTDQLAKQVDSLKKDIAEQSQVAAKKMDQAQQEMEKTASPEMQEAQKEMSPEQSPENQNQKPQSNPMSGNKKQKSQHSHQAQQAMTKAAEDLKKAQQSLEQDSNEEMAKRVRQAARDLVGVSGKQGEVNLGADSPAGLARDQQSLVDGTSQVVGQLQKAEQDLGPLPPSLMRGLGEALQSMKTSKDLFERGNTFAGRALGQEAQGQIGKTVVSMLDAAGSMCEKGGSGSGSGKKPGGQSKQQMAGLTQQQMSINKGTQQMMQGGGTAKRQSGGKTPGSSGQPGGQSAEEMAAQQDAVRQGIEDMAREQAQRKTMLGSLSDMADNMKKVADDQANNRVTEETVDMERKILSRMLDAQRSVNRRDRDPERWSRPGEAVARTSPGALPSGLTAHKLRSGLDLLRGGKDPVPQPYQPAVEQYFRNLPVAR